MNFAKLETEEIVAEVLKRSNAILQDNYWEGISRNGKAYYNYDTDKNCETSLVTTGDSGELIRVDCNQARSLIRSMVNLVSSDRLAFETIALSNSESTFACTRVAKSIVEDVVTRKNIDKLQDLAVEKFLVYGSSFYVCKWNTALGEPYVKDDKGSTLFTGDVDIQVKSPNEVLFDINCKDWNDVEWVIVRQRMNKYTIAAQYKKFAAKLEDLVSMMDEEGGLANNGISEDMVEVLEFYHKPTPALPEGRMVVFINDEIVLFDGKNPYKSLPVVPCIPTQMGDTIRGYALYSDLLPLQEMLDNEISSISSNHAAFGVQNVLIPRSCGMSIDEIGSLRLISYEAEGGVPSPLNLVQSSPELFKMIDVYKQNMMEISGINSTVRGAPPAGLTSGVAIATLSANSIKFASTYIKSSQIALEKLMEKVVEQFKLFATAERALAILGANNSYITLRFTNADIETISHIKMRTKNALSDTISGRIEIAQNLLNSGLITNPQDYLKVLETGELGVLTDEMSTEDDLIQSENEEIRNGNQVQAIIWDDHVTHISKHKMLLNNPIIRRESGIVGLVLAHIDEHLSLIEQGDPRILELAMSDSLSPESVMKKNTPPETGMAQPPPNTGMEAQPTEVVAHPLPLNTPLNQGVM